MPVSFRTTTSFFNDKAKSTMSETQDKIGKLSQQITTGKYTDSYQDFADKLSIDNFISLKDTKSMLDSKIRNNNVLNSKMSEMERVVRYTFETVVKDSLKLCMEMNNPATSNSIPVVALAKSQLSKIQSVLNTSFNGQKLFAGSKTDIQDVVGDIVNISNVIVGVTTANYYNGDQTILAENISSTQKLAYGITASDPAFQNLIAAHHYLIAGNNSAATTVLQQAKTGIADLLTQLGANNKSIDNQIDIDSDAVISLSTAISEIEDVDVTMLIPEITALELQLRASFMLTNRLSDLSLVNYLK